MPSQSDLDFTYLDVARAMSKLSKARRNRVGAVIVSANRIISEGYNGTPTGWSNACEDEEGNTLPEVLHAEANAIAKIARSTQSSQGAALFTTLAPCFECAKLIHQAGITRVVYAEPYRDPSGLELLQQLGVHCSCPTEVPVLNETTRRFINTVEHKFVEGLLDVERNGGGVITAGPLETWTTRFAVPNQALPGQLPSLRFTISAPSVTHAVFIAGMRFGRAFIDSERDSLETVLNTVTIELAKGEAVTDA